jgi:hypothetical protein
MVFMVYYHIKTPFCIMKQVNRTKTHTTFSHKVMTIPVNPTAPAIKKTGSENWKKSDPSSGAFSERYPRPSFFDYRILATGFETI